LLTNWGIFRLFLPRTSLQTPSTTNKFLINQQICFLVAPGILLSLTNVYVHNYDEVVSACLVPTVVSKVFDEDFKY
jgi:hypothetical protein